MNSEINLEQSQNISISSYNSSLIFNPHSSPEVAKKLLTDLLKKHLDRKLTKLEHKMKEGLKSLKFTGKVFIEFEKTLDSLEKGVKETMKEKEKALKKKEESKKEKFEAQKNKSKSLVPNKRLKISTRNDYLTNRTERNNLEKNNINNISTNNYKTEIAKKEHVRPKTFKGRKIKNENEENKNKIKPLKIDKISTMSSPMRPEDINAKTVTNFSSERKKDKKNIHNSVMSNKSKSIKKKIKPKQLELNKNFSDLGQHIKKIDKFTSEKTDKKNKTIIQDKIKKKIENKKQPEKKLINKKTNDKIKKSQIKKEKKEDDKKEESKKQEEKPENKEKEEKNKINKEEEKIIELENNKNEELIKDIKDDIENMENKNEEQILEQKEEIKDKKIEVVEKSEEKTEKIIEKEKEKKEEPKEEAKIKENFAKEPIKKDEENVAKIEIKENIETPIEITKDEIIPKENIEIKKEEDEEKKEEEKKKEEITKPEEVKQEEVTKIEEKKQDEIYQELNKNIEIKKEEDNIMTETIQPDTPKEKLEIIEEKKILLVKEEEPKKDEIKNTNDNNINTENPKPAEKIEEKNNENVMQKSGNGNNEHLIETLRKDNEEMKKENEEDLLKHYQSQFINLSLNQSMNQSMSFSQSFLQSRSILGEHPKEKVARDPNLPLTVDEMIKKYKNEFIYIFDFLDFKDRIQFTGIHKGFKNERIYLLNTKREEAIASLELKEKETLDDRINKFKLNYSSSEYTKPLGTFTVAKSSASAILSLDKPTFSNLFKQKVLDIKLSDIYIVFRVLFVFMNEIKIAEIVDDGEFWTKCIEYLNNNGKEKIGSFILAKSKEFDFSHKSIYLLNKLLVGIKPNINPAFFSKLSGTTGMLIFIIKEALEFCGVLVSKKTPKSRIYDNLIYYKNMIDHLTNFIDFLSKIKVTK